jgi:seryl-tRNA synthetase
MLDIRFIRENPEMVAEKAKQKGYKVDIKNLLDLDEKYRSWLQKKEDFSRQRNALAKQIKDDKASDQIDKGRELREQEKKLLKELDEVEVPLFEILKSVPNIFPDDTPIGDEKANREEKKWGDTSQPGFEVKNHLEWAESRGLVDFERGAKVAGNKFYYLKSSLVELELALAQFGIYLLKKYNFWPMSVPHLVNTRILEGTGFSAKGDEKQIYKVEGEDLNLIATAEIPLTGFFADEIIPLNWLQSVLPSRRWSLR